MKVKLPELSFLGNKTINNIEYKVFEDNILYLIEDNCENFPAGSTVHCGDCFKVEGTIKKRSDRDNKVFLSSAEWQYLD